MTEKTKLNLTKRICFFDLKSSLVHKNALKEFIYFLRYQGKSGVIDFSFANSNGSVLPNLSLKDNFILDAISTSLIKNQDANLRQKIESLSNTYLSELIDSLYPLERMVSELKKSEIKLTAFAKSLLSSSEYIFLCNPDEGHDLQTIELMKNAISHEVKFSNRTIFISSPNKEIWLDIVTDIIHKDSKHQYIVSDNILNPKQIDSLDNVESIFKNGPFQIPFKKAG